MSQIPNLRRWTIALLAGGVLFPITLGVVLGIGGVLKAMGDVAGSVVLNRIGLALGILWVLDLIALVLLQGLNNLISNHKNGDPTDES